MDWNFYSKRRRTSLSDFLRDVKTLDEALKLFEKRDIEPPSLEELQHHFASSFTHAENSVVEESSQTLDSQEEVIENHVDDALAVTSLKKKIVKSAAKLPTNASEG